MRCALVLLAACGAPPPPAHTIEPYTFVPHCEQLEELLAPSYPFVSTIRWLDHETLAVLVWESAAGSADRAGIAIWHIGDDRPRATHSGVIASDIARGSKLWLVSGPRVGVGTIDDGGCLRNRFEVQLGVIDAAHDRFFGVSAGTELDVVDAATLAIDRTAKLADHSHIIAYEPTTNRLVALEESRVEIFDGDSLARLGSLELGATATDEMWARPRYGEVDVAYSNPCTRMSEESDAAKQKCFEGAEAGLARVKLEPPSVQRVKFPIELWDPGIAEGWTGDGKLFVKASLEDSTNELAEAWLADAKAFGHLRLPRGYDRALSLSDDKRWAAQINTYAIAVGPLGRRATWIARLPGYYDGGAM